jgi:hypothetical protein
LRVRVTSAVVLVCLILVTIAPVFAERPAAPRLLPESTLAVAHVPDVPHLIDRFKQTAIGRISRDEQIKPLVSQLYATAQDFWKQIEPRVGLPLNEVLAIPQGELCVAFAALPDQRPGVIVILDVKDRLPQVKKMLAKGEELLLQNGGSRPEEKFGSQEYSIYQGVGRNQVCLFERDGTIIATSGKDLMQFVISAWEGTAEKTLADNDKYNTIMSRCAGPADDPPQITYFVDPIEGIRRLARGSFAATGLALFPVLGLDGIKGVGGSMIFASGEFDEVQHIHLLLDNPRDGVLQAIAMKSGDTTPEAWVSPDCITYTTIHWDFYQTYNVAAKLYNSLMGENEFQREVENRVSNRVGADFEKEILPTLDGRVSYVQWGEKPVRINSITNLLGLRLKDTAAATQALDKMIQRHADRLEKQRFGSVSYWSLRVPQRRDLAAGDTLRQPQPCFGIVGDYLLMSDSMAAFQQAVVSSTDPSRGLANSLDFKLIASKIKRQPGGDAPGMVSFARPEEGMRFWYDLASSDATKRQLAEQGANNPLFKSLDQALKDNPLPPFSVLAQYLSPGGGMMVNDETGIHYSTFTLKRE